MERSADLPAGPPDVDPVTFSVLLSRLDGIVDEMTRTVEHTARTAILAVARDYSCAIYDAGPRQLCMFDAIPIHTTSLHLALEEVQAAFEGEIADGDVFLCNAPYRGNTHNADLVAARPVFAGDRHLLWAVTKAHQLDVGACEPSSIVPHARDVWQEGLHVPPVKVVDRGRVRDDVVGLYLANVRYRRLLHGDLRAQLGSVGISHDRLAELIAAHGADELSRYLEAIVDYADRRMRAEVEAIPDGEYRATGWIDGVGVGAETDLPIEVAVAVDGDRVRVDYAGSAPQAPSAINGTAAAAQGAGAIPFLCYISPDIPHNEGCIRHVTVHAPEGTICNARHPAATHGSTQTPADCMVDTVSVAMAAALPERAIAGSARTHNIPQLSGAHGRNGEPWSAMLFNGAGGGGAARGADGWPLYLSPVSMGAIKVHAVEQLELTLPLLVEQMEAEPDSMGLGEFNGGPGVRLGLRTDGDDAEAITFGDGFRNPPHGLLGGTCGIGGGQYVEDLGDGRRRFMSAMAHYTLGAGQRRVGVSSGGGGYGDPAARDPERVRRDVRDGLVSRGRAAAVHGVVVSDDWDPRIDAEATARARRRLARRSRPLFEPDRPGAAGWAAERMRPGDEYALHPTVDRTG